MFYEASMNLREWKSNNTQVMDLMLEKDKANETCMKVLGMHWDSEADTLSVKPVKMLEMSFVTKRTVLKQVAKFFDPLGMFAPVTLKGKLFSQKLWIKQLEWDGKKAKKMKTCGLISKTTSDSDVCNLCFTKARNLKRHNKEQHLNSKCLLCSVNNCVSTFKRRSNFTHHLEKKHHFDKSESRQTTIKAKPKSIQTLV